MPPPIYITTSPVVRRRLLLLDYLVTLFQYLVFTKSSYSKPNRTKLARISKGFMKDTHIYLPLTYHKETEEKPSDADNKIDSYV